MVTPCAATIGICMWPWILLMLYFLYPMESKPKSVSLHMGRPDNNKSSVCQTNSSTWWALGGHRGTLLAGGFLIMPHLRIPFYGICTPTWHKWLNVTLNEDKAQVPQYKWLSRLEHKEILSITACVSTTYKKKDPAPKWPVWVLETIRPMSTDFILDPIPIHQTAKLEWNCPQLKVLKAI